MWPFVLWTCLSGTPVERVSAAPASTTSYPLGIYGVPSTNDFAEIRAAGFNLVAGQADRTYLDAAESCGLKVLAAPLTSAGPHFDEAAAARAVKEFDRHPALWAWYLVDEPDLNELPPSEVVRCNRFIKGLNASRPTALVLYRGYEALDYANISDILMVDRYPVPWLPLASLGQHVQLCRLALGKDKPLVAVIQAFDWNCYRSSLPGERHLRPPTRDEIRCMTYDALAQGANGLFYFAFDSGWKMRDHPETWAALKAVVSEVNERCPLFQGQRQWWPRNHSFGNRRFRFNAALSSSVSSCWLRVSQGNDRFEAGDYIVAVNTTEHTLDYSFALPPGTTAAPPTNGLFRLPAVAVPVVGEGRSLHPNKNRLSDRFKRYAVHVYGPLPRPPS